MKKNQKDFVPIKNDRRPESPFRTLLDYIGYSEAHAVSNDALAQLMDMTPRDVRRMIERARMAGNVIAFSESGYFIPDNYNELSDYCARMVSKITTSVHAFAPAYRMLGLSIDITLDKEEAEDDEL